MKFVFRHFPRFFSSRSSGPKFSSSQAFKLQLNSPALTRSAFDGSIYLNPFPRTWTQYSTSESLKQLHEWNNSPIRHHPFKTPAKYVEAIKNSAGLKSAEIPSLHSDAAVFDKTLPVLKPDFSIFSNSADDNSLAYCWLGHATSLIHLGGLNILTDPFFSSRSSALQFIGPARFRPAACAVADLPRVDLVLISHNHYDHLDTDSIRQLLLQSADQQAVSGEEIKFVVPLGLREFLEETGVKRANIYELDWNEYYHYPKLNNLKFFSLPCQHWSGRYVFDRQKSLWASFRVEFNGRSFFWTGDTGYCSATKEIGQVFPTCDLSAIPIGAFEPRRWMKPMHINPAEAIKIHRDINSRHSFGVHWGSIILTDEFYLAPKFELENERKLAGINEQQFNVTAIGQTVVLSN